MLGKRVSVIAGSVVTCAMLAFPATGSAQGYRSIDNRASVAVQCGPGQRAVIEQREGYRGSHTIARCVGSRRFVDSGYNRARYGRVGTYDSYRPVSRRGYYYAPRRSKSRSALMIAGSAATGAGIGGAIRGGKGALIGAAIGGGTASIYEATKRRP
jgi:hypothetical protein